MVLNLSYDYAQRKVIHTSHMIGWLYDSACNFTFTALQRWLLQYGSSSKSNYIPHPLSIAGQAKPNELAASSIPLTVNYYCAEQLPTVSAAARERGTLGQV